MQPHNQYHGSKDLQALSQTGQALLWICHHTPGLRKRSRASDLPGKQRNTEVSLLLGRDSALQTKEKHRLCSVTNRMGHVIGIALVVTGCRVGQKNYLVRA